MSDDGHILVDPRGSVREIDLATDPGPVGTERSLILPPAAERERPERRLKASDFYRYLARVLTLLDIACILLAAAVVLLFATPSGSGVMVLLGVTGASLIWTLVFRSYGLHCPHLISGPEEFRKVLSASSVGALVAGSVLTWSSALSFREIAAMWAIVVSLELGIHRVARWRVAKLRKDRRLAFRTLIVGTNEEAKNLRDLLDEPTLGYEPLGFVATDSVPQSSDCRDTLGNIRALPDLLWELQAECIFVASSALAGKDMLRVTQAARQGGAEVRISANVPDLFFSRLAVQSMGDVTSLTLRPVKLSGGQAVVKRSADVVLSMTALVLSAPLFLLVSLAIKSTSPGPVLFKQNRMTRAGHVFTMLKFRTMTDGAGDTPDALRHDPSQAFFKVTNDPRLTPVGRILRRLSLDELPQLINVLRGEMSLVGPRPLPAEQVAANLELLAPRHEVRAGMTGWWQTNGRSELDAEEAVRLDLFYIENWSLALDLYILLKTIGAVLSGRGAY